MALNTNATKLTNLFNPQVVGDLINAKLVDAIKFFPYVYDNTLVGRPVVLLSRLYRRCRYSSEGRYLISLITLLKQPFIRLVGVR